MGVVRLQECKRMKTKRKTWNEWKRDRARIVRKRLAKGIETDSINYPDIPSEFEIQSRLFHALQSLGFDVRGEVRAGVRSRFDLVIFRDKKPVRIIEVKKRKIKPNTKSVAFQNQRREMLSQIERYRLYGITVDVVQGMKDAELYLQVFSIDMAPYATITKAQVCEVHQRLRFDEWNQNNAKSN